MILQHLQKIKLQKPFFSSLRFFWKFGAISFFEDKEFRYPEVADSIEFWYPEVADSIEVIASESSSFSSFSFKQKVFTSISPSIKLESNARKSFLKLKS